MSDKEIQVSLFQPELAGAAAPAPVRRSPLRLPLPGLPARNLLGSSLCALLTILLHGVILAPLFLGSGGPLKQTRPAQLASAAGEEQRASVLQVRFIEEDQLLDSPSAAGHPGDPQLVQLSEHLISIAPPSPDLLGAAAAAQPLGPKADSAAAGASQLAGRYLGQIDARIERVWLRPRTAIGAASFLCRVRIEQDAAGNVREVTLQQCNGDIRWQLSLVRAIQAASPLPAPPDPAVFRSTVNLGFSARAYSPKGSEEGYEPATVAEAQSRQASGSSDTAPSELVPDADGIIHLSITGHP